MAMNGPLSYDAAPRVRRPALLLLVGATLLISGGSSAGATPRNTLTFHGQVRDSSGAPIPQAWVYTRGSRRVGVYADSAGRYELVVPGALPEEMARVPFKLRVQARSRGWRIALANGALELGIEMQVSIDSASAPRLRVRSNEAAAARAVANAGMLEAGPRLALDLDFSGTRGEQMENPPVELPVVEEVRITAPVRVTAQQPTPIRTAPGPIKALVARAAAPTPSAPSPHGAAAQAQVRADTAFAARARLASDSTRAEKRRQKDEAGRARAEERRLKQEAHRAAAIERHTARQAERAAAAARKSAAAEKRASAADRGADAASTRDHRRPRVVRPALAPDEQARSEKHRPRAARAETSGRGASSGVQSTKGGDSGSVRTPVPDSRTDSNVVAGSEPTAHAGPPDTSPTSAEPAGAILAESNPAPEAASTPAASPAESTSVAVVLTSAHDPRASQPPPRPESARPQAPPSEPAASPVAIAQDSCSCRVSGTVEINSDRSIDPKTLVELWVDGSPPARCVVEMFLGSPRAFALQSVPCGPHRIQFRVHARQRYALSLPRDPLVDCTRGLGRDLDLVFTPTRKGKPR
jgi:hypothetical protein